MLQLQQLAQQAALESLCHCSLVLFCADVSKTDWQEDLAAFKQLTNQAVVLIATKSDRLQAHELGHQQSALAALFGRSPLLISSQTGHNLTSLIDQLEHALQHIHAPGLANSQRPDLENTPFLTLRHRQALTEALDSIDAAVHELELAHDEVAAMMIRAAFQALGDIEQHIDDEVLDRIFSQFCIGK